MHRWWDLPLIVCFLQCPSFSPSMTYEFHLAPCAYLFGPSQGARNHSKQSPP